MCHMISESFKKDLNGAYDLVAARDTKKELSLVCYNCHRMLEKTFVLDENFFDEVKKVFNRIISKKVWTKSGNCRYLPPENKTLIDLLYKNLEKYVKGKIVISHCKGHKCITPLFYFDGFCDTHLQLLSNFFYRQKVQTGFY